jgi:hypothetical protein
MRTIKLKEEELISLVKSAIGESKFNIIKFSDLTKSGDWDARRHGREEKGIYMFKMDNGLLKKINKQPNSKIGNNNSVYVFYLTDKEFEKANELLSKAKELESQAKKHREAAKFIIHGGLEMPYSK